MKKYRLIHDGSPWHEFPWSVERFVNGYWESITDTLSFTVRIYRIHNKFYLFPRFDEYWAINFLKWKFKWE